MCRRSPFVTRASEYDSTNLSVKLRCGVPQSLFFAEHRLYRTYSRTINALAALPPNYLESVPQLSASPNLLGILPPCPL